MATTTTTTKYEKDIERINKLYFHGFYDILDMSRMLKIHPNKLIEIMLNVKIVFYKRAIGGYSSYKLFNNIDKRLKLIENKVDEIETELYNKDDDLYDDLNFNEDDEIDIDDEPAADLEEEEEPEEEKNDIYSKIYEILFTDEDDEEEPEEEDEDDVDEDTVSEDAEGEDEAVQNKKNTYFDSILKKHSVCDFIFGDFVFFSAVLFNVSVLVVGFAYYYKHLTFPV